MNPNLFAMIAVVLAGGATALQAPTNAKLSYTAEILQHQKD